jgi:hypothetical protein
MSASSRDSVPCSFACSSPATSTGVSAAKTLYIVGGPIFSGSTIGRVGYGRKELTLGLLSDLATVLGIPLGDMADLTGIEMAGPPPPQDPKMTEVAGLIWDVRPLSAEQVRQLSDEAGSS